jgi:hypothetical protein
MEENRKFRRVNLREHPEVYDAHSNKLLGKIVDISTDGFKMVTNSEMEQGKEYLLKIVLPEKNSEKKCVDVKARVRWRGKESDPELLTSGCYLVEINALGRLNLATLMLGGAKPGHDDIT